MNFIEHTIKKLATLCFALFLLPIGFVGIANAKKKKVKNPPQPKFIKISYKKAKRGKNPGCHSKFPRKGRWDKAFLHVFNNTCYSCPRGFRRSLDPNVAGRRACVKAGRKLYKKAKYVGRVKKKFLKVWCAKGFRHGLTNKCYTCPRSYKRTVFGINSRKACERAFRALHKSAKRRGKPGCQRGYFQNGLLNQCYQCPRGYKRSAVISAKLDKNRKACVKVKIDKSAFKNTAFVRKVRARTKVMVKKYTPLMKRIAKLVKGMKGGKLSVKNLITGSPKVRARELSSAVKRTNLINIVKSILKKKGNTKDSTLKENGETCAGNVECKSGNCETFNGARTCMESGDIKTISVAINLDASFIIGGTWSMIMLAWSLDKNRGRACAVGYTATAWSIGLTAGADANPPEIGFWTDTNENLAGASHGVVVAAAFKGGLGFSFWWAYDKEGGVATGAAQKPRFLGFTITPQIGAGAELEYSRAMTTYIEGQPTGCN